MLISVLARNGKGGVSLVVAFDLYRAMGSGFNFNLDIVRSFEQITTTYLYNQSVQLQLGNYRTLHRT